MRESQANYLERSLTQFLATQENNSLEITEAEGVPYFTLACIVDTSSHPGANQLKEGRYCRDTGDKNPLLFHSIHQLDPNPYAFCLELLTFSGPEIFTSHLNGF